MPNKPVAKSEAHEGEKAAKFPKIAKEPDRFAQKEADAGFPRMTNNEKPVKGMCKGCSAEGLVLSVGKQPPYCAKCWSEFKSAFM